LPPYRTMSPFFLPTLDCRLPDLRALVERVSWPSSERPALIGIEESENYAHWELFDTLVSRHQTWISYDSLPLISNGVESAAIPFCYYTHSEHKIGETNLEEWLTEYLNKHILGKKYLFSCDPNLFLAISFDKFGYDHLDLGIQLYGENSNFVLFSQDRERWAIFHGSFPFVILSKKSKNSWAEKDREVEEIIRTSFERNFDEAFSRNSESFRKFFIQTYAPRISNCYWLTS